MYTSVVFHVTPLREKTSEVMSRIGAVNLQLVQISRGGNCTFGALASVLGSSCRRLLICVGGIYTYNNYVLLKTATCTVNS